MTHPEAKTFRQLVEALRKIRAGNYKSLLDSPADSIEDKQLLIDEINLLLEAFQKKQKDNICFKAALLSDIDYLADTLEKIALGNFELTMRDVELPELETMLIGIEDMAVKLKQYSIELEEKIKELEDNQQELKKEREAAMAATRAKSEFLANMSHEIRTPMNAIIGLSELALSSNLNSRQEGYLKKIKGSSRVLLNIINDILDFSKIEAGKMELEQENFHLRELLENVIDIFSGSVSEKSLELLFSLDRSIPNDLYGDHSRLGQVLINLIGNSVKFTTTGEIILTVSMIKADEDKIQLSFSVKDTGIGIPKDKLDSLFDSFTQADTSTTRQYGGTGLGLAICKRLVGMMNGFITVTSTVGKGSTFEFSAEFLRNKNIRQTEEFSPVQLKGKRVLIVEDNEPAAKIFMEVLESFTMIPTHVTNGQEAIEELRYSDPGTFDLILMDWKMPVMDGIEATRMIKEHPDLEDIPVILLTAYGSEMVWQSARHVGVDAFLLKPLKQSQLFNTIIELMDGQPFTLHQSKKGERERQLMARIAGIKVLLVEDNYINQQMAQELLERAGVKVDVADNGITAFHRLASSMYDAILMDVQMPVMDGYDATRVIRMGVLEDPEKPDPLKIPKHKRAIPIIAMTAHALKGDKERCLESGMDDYLTKPIDLEGLYETLAKWAPGKIVELSEGTGGQVDAEPLPLFDDIPQTLPGLDLSKGLERIGGNRTLYIKILRDFYNENSQFVDEFHQRISAGDLETSQRMVHTVKGVVGSLGAMSLFDQAIKLNKLLLSVSV